MVYLLYHPRSRPGGRIMAEALGVEAGISLRGRSPEVLVRWGSQRSVSPVPLVINPADALAKASDKYRAFGFMRVDGVPTPDFTVVWEEAVRMREQEGWDYIGRTRHGFGGQGIEVYAGVDPQPGHELYVQFIPARDEYRLHVVGEEVVRVQQKQGPDGGKIKNYKNGYRFVGVVSRRLHSDRYDAAIAAVRSLGLDFGAVDLLISEDGKPFILEVNTAPACSPLTARTFADAIKRQIERRANE